MPIPIADENPTHFSHKSIITFIIIGLNVAVFIVLQQGLFDNVTDLSVLGFGLIPSVFWGDKFLDPNIMAFSAEYTLISYMFLHGGWMHLISNMLILWVFGDNIEQDLGRFAYLMFYLLGGIAAGLLHLLLSVGSDAPLIGASGAVSAIGAAYLLIHPKAKIWLLLFWVFPVKIPAWVAICAWFAYQIYASTLGVQTGGGELEVAWWAHIGGFVFGIGYILLFKRILISPIYTDLFTK